MKNKGLDLDHFNVVFFVRTSDHDTKRIKAIVDRKEMNMIVMSGYDQMKMDQNPVF